MPGEAIPETIIRQHRRWTQRMESLRVAGEGNLILTNRRLLFLHKVERGPEVAAAIKKLADAPTEAVLDHALTLHKDSIQMPLLSILRVGIGLVPRFPFPRFYLTVYYREGKKQAYRALAFQFKRPRSEILTPPQVVADWNWRRAIRRAIREASRRQTVNGKRYRAG